MYVRRDTASSASPRSRLCQLFYRYFWWIGLAVTVLGNIILLNHSVQIVWTPATTAIHNIGASNIQQPLLSPHQAKNNHKIRKTSQNVDIHANTLIVDDPKSEAEQPSKSSDATTNENQVKPKQQTERKRPMEEKQDESSLTYYDHSFSICLLIKDDNDILNEWIAYHYHTLKLRHIIVAMDPTSVTSPKSILDTWQANFADFQYEIWNDKDYMPDFFLQGQYDYVPRMIKMEDKNATKWQEEGVVVSAQHLQQDYQQINNHRYRQSKFLQHCSRTLQDRHKTWMSHIDTDEYIVLNPLLRSTKPTKLTTKTNGVVFPPSQLNANSLWKLLETLYEHDPATINWPCLSMPRVLYGSVQDDKFNNNENHFETLSWKYHADYENDALNKQPKVIMDVSGFPSFNLTKKAFSIHRPSLRLCRGRSNIHVSDTANYPLIVHHYVGSLDRYQARDDPRRTQKAYREKAMVRDGKDDDWVDSWLTSFIEEHGKEKVARVLGSAAISSYNDHSIISEEVDVTKPAALGPVTPLAEDSFSACLLVKDDNDILNEWIAYHYHVLKLRTLVLAVDPSSMTSPSELLSRWKPLMDISEWTDENYMPTFFLKGDYGAVPDLMGTNTTNSSAQFRLDQDGDKDQETARLEWQNINNHRFRQATFLQGCTNHLKDRNKTWMVHIDTDEYIVMHHQVRTKSYWKKTVHVQPQIGPSSILSFLKEASKDYTKAISYPCISMPRLLFGSKEDKESEKYSSNNGLPAPFNATKFETIRWKHHSAYDQNVQLNGRPKVILDLSGLPPRSLFLNVAGKGVFSIHRPGLRICRGDKDVLFNVSHKFPITINHYVGSWERYTSRKDARRNWDTYNKKASVAFAKDDNWINGWVASFVKQVGLERARQLLADYTIIGHNHESMPVFKPDEIEEVNNDDAGQTDSAPGPKGKAKPVALETFDASKSMEFSACLLTKDDNDILDEWIAYHYQVLGLRYIIVAVDAKSHTSPTPILEKWRAFGMTIEEWKDEMFMPDSYFQKAYHLQPRLVKIKKNKHKWLEGVDDPTVMKEYVNSIQDHRFRQIVFVSQCAKRLREQNRTWMVHIDTDEYIVINPKLRKLQRFNQTIDIPPHVEGSIVPRLLNQMVVSRWDTVNYPCVSLPRLLYGSVEDHSSEHKQTIPRGFNASRFETIRWKYHADFGDSDLNKQPKVIIDVSAIPLDDPMLTEGRVFSIHRPSQYLCRNQGQMDFVMTEYYPFSVNHYLGTFERFGTRDDLRRNRKLYDQKANVEAGKDDDWIDGWLDSFIQDAGREKVMEVLSQYLTD